MNFLVKPVAPVNMSPFAFAAASACATLVCNPLNCVLDGGCDLTCRLKVIKL